MTFMDTYLIYVKYKIYLPLLDIYLAILVYVKLFQCLFYLIAYMTMNIIYMNMNSTNRSMLDINEVIKIKSTLGHIVHKTKKLVSG